MDTHDPASGPPLAEIVTRLRAAGCVFAEDEAELLTEEAGTAAELEAWLARRVTGEPLEQIVGWAEFAGRRIRVAPGVFVPRRRTELMVRLAAGALVAGDVLVDVGCGTGAVAAAVLAEVPGVDAYAVDIDPAAVACARLNLPGARVLQGDLLAPLPPSVRGRIGAMAANMPYVPTDAVGLMPPEAREHEHRVALDGGPDGLDVQRRLIAAAPGWLRPGGVLLAEVSRAQVDRAADLFRSAGLRASVEHDDDIDATVVRGTAAVLR